MGRRGQWAGIFVSGEGSKEGSETMVRGPEGFTNQAFKLTYSCCF